MSRHRQNHPSYAAARTVRCLLRDFQRHDDLSQSRLAKRRAGSAGEAEGRAGDSSGLFDLPDDEDDDDDEGESTSDGGSGDSDSGEQGRGGKGGEQSGGDPDEDDGFGGLLAMRYGGWVSDLAG